MYWFEIPATALLLRAQFQAYSGSSALAWLLCTGNRKMLWLYFNIQKRPQKPFPVFFWGCFFIYFSLCSSFSPAEPDRLAKAFPVTQITYKATFFNTLFCQQGWFPVCVVVSSDTATDQTFVLVLGRKHYWTTPALASPSWPHYGKMATESLSRTPAPSLTCC